MDCGLRSDNIRAALVSAPRCGWTGIRATIRDDIVIVDQQNARLQTAGIRIHLELGTEAG